MELTRDKAVYWAPRILSISFILFFSMFSLDVFSENYTILETFAALFMHNVPTFLLVFALIIAWKKQAAGGILFLILGLISVLLFRTYQDPIIFLIISVPVIAIGLMFIFLKKK
ncbi:hypothetical protein GF327_04150 [Candidatus Woesearchaeota archaeon]|nr:hypothetical protein [Candidatus Woesearchaeota archaeon]